MSELNCKETLAKVFDYLANDLDDGEKSLVSSHVSNCEPCNKEFAIESKISHVISNSSVDAQSSFASKMQNRLQSEL